MFRLWMLFLDRPEHSRLRNLLNKSFTPREVDGMRPRIQRIVDRLLDRVINAGSDGLHHGLCLPAAG